MYLTSVRKDNVKGDDVVESQAPFPRVQAEAAVQGMSRNPDARACTMRECSLPLRKEGLSNIAESLACSNFGDERS